MHENCHNASPIEYGVKVAIQQSTFTVGDMMWMDLYWIVNQAAPLYLCIYVHSAIFFDEDRLDRLFLSVSSI